MTTWTDTASQIYWPPPNKPSGQDTVIGFYGQSNCTGVYELAGMVNNNSVLVWKATTPPATGPFIWEVADMGADNAYANGLYTGLHGEDHGNIGWSCLDRLQKKYGGTFCLQTTHFNGSPISAFINGGSAQLEIEAQVPLALAARTNGPNSLDAVIWMQGESDAGRATQDYVDDLTTFRNNLITKELLDEDAPFIVCDIADLYYVNNPNFDGLKEFVRQTNKPNVVLVSALGIETFTDVAFHFSGAGLDKMGQRVADCLINNLSQRWVENNALERA